MFYFRLSDGNVVMLQTELSPKSDKKKKKKSSKIYTSKNLSFECVPSLGIVLIMC